MAHCFQEKKQPQYFIAMIATVALPETTVRHQMGKRTFFFLTLRYVVFFFKSTLHSDEALCRFEHPIKFCHVPLGWTVIKTAAYAKSKLQ